MPIADPRFRRKDRPLANEEIPSVIRESNYKPVLVEYDEVSEGHFVAIE